MPNPSPTLCAEYHWSRGEGWETPLDQQAIVRRYARNLDGKAKARDYLAIVSRWFRLSRPAMSAGMRPTDADVRAYVAARRAAGADDSTVLHELGAVRRMYALVRCELPRPDLDLRPPAETGPTLHPDSIRRLIAWARRPETPAVARGYVAVSTLYGARASEIAAVRAEDVDLEARRIYLWTRKKGDRRWQSIPAAAAWAFAAAWRPVRVDRVHDWFHAACEGAGVRRDPGVGWHGVRRGLQHALREAGVSLESRRALMRWSPRRTDGGADIADWYAGASRLLGPDGWVEARRQDPDAEAWAHHPFVVAWDRRERP